MNENHNSKNNYKDPQREYENSFGQPAYLPNNHDYNRGYTDSFYDEYESSGAGSFLIGALVGGVIGAAAALFLAPKTGKEMRDDLSTQAVQLKDKSIEISAVAKDKAVEFTSVAKERANEFTAVAKEKTGEVTKTIQEQSEQLVDKVKSMKSKTSVPMDDGTASSEGEEASEYIDAAVDKTEETVTATAEAFKEAVIKE